MTNFEKITKSPEALAEFLMGYELEPLLICPEGAWKPGTDMPQCPKHGSCALCAIRYFNEDAEE